MLNNLEATIQKLIANAASSIAKEIAHSIRQTIAAEIVGNSGGASLSAPIAPKRRGRPPGVAKTAAVAPAAKPTSAKRGKSKRTPITKADLDVILAVIAKKPGLGSKAIQAAAGVEKKQAVRVLAKLRVLKAVKVTGEKSKATYSVS